MYDILQLNDMLVPELLDIAEQLNIPNAKKSDKQELIYKILDRQALASGAPSKNGTEKPKRKRIIKANTANTTEEAEVISEPEKPVKAAAITPQPEAKEDKLKKKGRKPKEKEEEAEPEEKKTAAPEKSEPVQLDIPELELGSRLISMLGDDDPIMLDDDIDTADDAADEVAVARPYKKEAAFNIEFDGVIQAEGVLEMMPDGYGFLR